jgi:hypothetical protein
MSNAYDHEPRKTAGKFLRLASKDQSVKIRIATEPYREPVVWLEGRKDPLKAEELSGLSMDQWAKIMGNPDYNVNERYSWGVIDRTDGKARIFSVSPGVYRSVRDYAQDMEDWGDPTQYDFTITRTEEPGRNYYTVKPSPNKSPISERESIMVEDLDIAKELPLARIPSETGEEQVDYISDEYQGRDNAGDGVDEPALKPSNKVRKDDVVIEDIGDEPVNLDDIPF